MRKRVFGRQLSRGRKSRTALFRSLLRALILNGKIKTTKAKAKAIQPTAEKLVTLAKQASVSSRRKAMRFLPERESLDILFSKIAPAFSTRNGGYTRIILYPPRRGDSAEIAVLEWVESIKIEQESKQAKKAITKQGNKTTKKADKKEVPEKIKKETKKPNKIRKK